MVTKKTKDIPKRATRGRLTVVQKQKAPDYYQFMKNAETQLCNMRESIKDIFERFEHFHTSFRKQLAEFPVAETPILIQNGASKQKHDVLINGVEEISSTQQDVSTTLARDSAETALKTKIDRLQKTVSTRLSMSTESDSVKTSAKTSKKRKTRKSKAVIKHASDSVTKPNSERETEFQPSSSKSVLSGEFLRKSLQSITSPCGPSMPELSGESFNEPSQSNTFPCGPSMPVLGEESINESIEDNERKLEKLLCEKELIVIMKFLPQNLLDAAKKNDNSSDEDDFIEISPKVPKKVALSKETSQRVPKKVVFSKDTVIEQKKKDIDNGSKDVEYFESKILNTSGPKKIGKRRNTVCIDYNHSNKQVRPSAPLDNSTRVHGRMFGPRFASPDTRKKILDNQNDVLSSPKFGSKHHAHTDTEPTPSTNAGSSLAKDATKHKKIEAKDVLQNRSVNNFQRYFLQITAENELKEAAKRNNAIKDKPVDDAQGYKLPE